MMHSNPQHPSRVCWHIFMHVFAVFQSPGSIEPQRTGCGSIPFGAFAQCILQYFIPPNLPLLPTKDMYIVRPTRLGWLLLQASWTFTLDSKHALSSESQGSQNLANLEANLCCSKHIWNGTTKWKTLPSLACTALDGLLEPLNWMSLNLEIKHEGVSINCNRFKKLFLQPQTVLH